MLVHHVHVHVHHVPTVCRCQNQNTVFRAATTLLAYFTGGGYEETFAPRCDSYLNLYYGYLTPVTYNKLPIAYVCFAYFSVYCKVRFEDFSEI